MSWLDGAASLTLKAAQRAGAALATHAARRAASVAPGARFLRGGSVANIAGRAELISVAHGCRIAGQLLVFRHGGTIRLGEWCYVGEGSRLWSAQRIDVGDRVLISHNVNVHDCDSHALDAAARHAQFREIASTGHPQAPTGIAAAAVVIEDDVWIGFNSIVLKGSHIGARSVIAAGSIVNGEVPPDSLYIGSAVKRKLNADDRGK